jgi:alpha-glucosidase
VRFWLDRGVDGYRLDAIHALMKDPELRDDPPASTPFPFPLFEDYARLEHRHSLNSPDTHRALAALREAAGDDLLVGEVYLPAADTAAYLDYMDLVFAFELLHSPWELGRLRAAVETGAALRRGEGPGTAWVFSNHDFGRLPSRFGGANVRLAAMLLLTLPGTAFVYQGDEIGMVNGPGANPPFDRAGRDAARHPMQWDPSPRGGFTTGTPWLPPVDPRERNVEAQREDPGSLLSLYRELIALRPRLGEGFELLEAEPGVLAYRRGANVVALNLSSEERGRPGSEVLLATDGGAGSRRLPPHGGVVAALD